MPIDTVIDGRPVRKYRRGIIRFLYPCIGCGEAYVVKQGSHCPSCAGKLREANHRKQGIRHPSNRPFASALLPRSSGCAAHWIIKTDEAKHEVGKCLKFSNGLCRDTGKACPYDGIRDFTALQERGAKRLKRLESNSLGGDMSGAVRSGRPRKFPETAEIGAEGY